MQARLIGTTLVIIAITSNLWSQIKPEFSKQELHSDLDYLYSNLIKYNPAVGVFHPKEELEETYDSLRSQIDRPMPDVEFYPMVSALLAGMREGHTIAIDNKDTVTAIAKGFYNGDIAYMPLSVKHLNDVYFVSGNFSASDRPERGDQLVSINDIPISEVVNKIMPYMQVDGNIALARKNVACENFGAHYYWFVEKADAFTVTFIPQGSSSRKSVTTSALPRDSMIYWRNERYGIPEPDTPSIDDVYTLEIHDTYAILDLNTFSRSQMERYDIKPDKLYAEVFRKLSERDVSNLIIDLRNNNGGRKEYAWEILPFILSENKKGVVYESTSWKGKKSTYKFPKRAKNAFSGQIYVLINNRSFSNGSVVAAYAKAYGNAILIGSETRSRYEGFAAGSTQKLVLPNTRISIFTPRYSYQYQFSDPETYNRGVLPDYEISYSSEEWLDKQDKEMKFAIRLIEGQN